MRTSSVELEDLLARSSEPLTRLLDKLALAWVDRDPPRWAHLYLEAGKLVRNSLILADLSGRERLLREARSLRAVSADNLVIPAVPFVEAIEDLVSREPALASSAEVVQAVWRAKSFAIRRSIDEHVTAEVQNRIASVMRNGATLDQARALISEALRTQDPKLLEAAGISPDGLTSAYAETVYRTAASSAYTEGRMDQVRDPEVRDLLDGIVDGWRYEAVGDSDTRPNHLAADGVVAPFDDPAWKLLRPPLGFNCRCNLALASADEPGKTPAAAIAAGAGPDEGFSSGT